MTTTLNDLGISLNQPLYLYQQPMFSITVSVVLIVENGVCLLKENDTYKFPGGNVKASQETIQFAAVRYVKEQVGIMLKKDALIPVDFRSDPERTKEKNVVDIGFVCIPHDILPETVMANKPGIKWEAVDFENKCLIHPSKFCMDHEVLLERAIEIAGMIKE